MKKSVKGLFVAAAAVAAVSLTACAPKTADKAKEKLEKKDYVVEVTSGTEVELVATFLGIDGLESVVAATKTVDDKVEGVVAYYFESSSDAKDAMETFEKMAEEDADEIDDVKRSGKVIYAGTEQGMKDFD